MYGDIELGYFCRLWVKYNPLALSSWYYMVSVLGNIHGKVKEGLNVYIVHTG